MRITYLSIFLFIILITSCSPVEENKERYEQTVETSINDSKMEEELIILINNYRTSNGLHKLQLSNSAYKYANQHTSYMIDLGEINHDNFSQRAADLSTETNAILVAENVAKDYEGAVETFNAWIKSDGHKLNIISDYTHTGVSVKKNNNGDYYYTQMFYK